jgi:hypothetical protein
VIHQTTVIGITVLQEAERMSNTRHTDHDLVLPSDVTIRPATADDRRELQRLAQLDSTRLPGGPMLVATAGDEFRAAYSVTEKRAIANPFRRTAELVELLAIRAKQLNGGRRRRSSAPQPPGIPVGFPSPKLDRRTA